jgi:hypothetical protein
MKTVLFFMSLMLYVIPIAHASAQVGPNRPAPDMFKDVDIHSWTYSSMEHLRYQNIVIGYPDGYFRGKRTLTRFEFAVALDRALRNLSASLPYRTPAPSPLHMIRTLTELEFLVEEFKEEIGARETDIKAGKRNLRTAYTATVLAIMFNRIPSKNMTFMDLFAEHGHAYLETPLMLSGYINAPKNEPPVQQYYITMGFNSPLFPESKIHPLVSGWRCGFSDPSRGTAFRNSWELDLLHGGYKKPDP